jgi:hypothetical protein
MEDKKEAKGPSVRMVPSKEKIMQALLNREAASAPRETGIREKILHASSSEELEAIMKIAGEYKGVSEKTKIRWAKTMAVTMRRIRETAK